MYKTRKRTSRGLVILLTFTGVTFLLYLASLFIFAYLATGAGDAALNSFPNIAKYYFDSTLQLFVFSYANSANVAYFALSCFLYALIVCWIIFLIAAIIVAGKKRRRVLWWGVFLSFINLLVYLLFAAGSQKYWHIVNSRQPFGENRELMFITLLLIFFGAVYFLLSIASYFWSIVESYRNPRVLKVEEQTSSIVYEEEDDEHIRRIVRDELIKNQPFKVVIVGNETVKEEPAPAPVVEEPVKEAEPEPEPVVEEEPAVMMEEIKEEPKPVKEEKKVIFGTIDFWKVARTVWPQLDNPKPLPKEEKAEEVVQAEEEEEGWNRNKRQPFFVRIITAEAQTKVNYNELKNEILSYGVKARLSRGGETFRLKDKKYVKIYLVGKTLKVYLALSPEDYKDSTFPIEDVGHRPNYAEMPLLFKVRSSLSVRRCKELIKAAMEKDELTQGEVLDTNWVDELRVLNAEKAKNKKAR